MNCEHVHRVLDAFVDSELDDTTQAQVESHLAACPGCARRRAERDALRSGLRQLPRHELPARLRSAVRSALAGEGQPVAVPPHPRWLWRRPDSAVTRAVTRFAASLALTAITAFLLGLWLATPPRVQDLREYAIAQHVASFDSGTPRVQVTSTDRHIVKPWFAGKLDFAPPVRELSGQGFVLAGGRLDRLDGQTAAVLVYRVRQHPISLFVSRTPGADSSPMLVSSLRGFAVVTWSQDGLAFAAVSDVDARDLQRFAVLVQAPASLP